MIRLSKLLWDFVQKDFNSTKYLLILLWACSLLFLKFEFDLENSVIDGLEQGWQRFLGYFSLYSAAYFVSVLIVTFRKGIYPFKNRRFLMISLMGLVVYSADCGFVFHGLITDWINPNVELLGFYFKTLAHMIEFISIALPLFIINRFLIPNHTDNLGVNKKEIELKPFFIILALIAPFILISAFERGLNNYYPTFKYYQVAEIWDVPTLVPITIYEFFYGADFFNVELIFRGFFVIGLISVLGRDAVLPMIVFYCTIHFGKPNLEAISSLFGGYALGAIAYQTRSTWGGVILHIGLAWMMELSAFLVKWWLSY